MMCARLNYYCKLKKVSYNLKRVFNIFYIIYLKYLLNSFTPL